MSIPTTLSSLAGEWLGVNQLWLSPGEPAHTSDASATLTLVARGKFLTLHYTWSYDGAPQDGCLLVGEDQSEGSVSAVWIDSWHMQEEIMTCQGQIQAGGGFSVRGSYAAPPGPDWGWRIDLLPLRGDAFELVMYNITPEGEEHLAVRATYPRAG